MAEESSPDHGHFSAGARLTYGRSAASSASARSTHGGPRRPDTSRCRSTAGHSRASKPPVRNATSQCVARYQLGHRSAFSTLATSSWLCQIRPASPRCVSPRASRQRRNSAPNRSRAEASGVKSRGRRPIPNPTAGPHNQTSAPASAPACRHHQIPSLPAHTRQWQAERRCSWKRAHLTVTGDFRLRRNSHRADRDSHRRLTR